MRHISVLLVVAFAVAGCSGSKGNDGEATGDFAILVADSLAGGKLDLGGAYLRSSAGWQQAFGNSTTLSFRGTGGNVSANGALPPGDYDRLRLTFASVEVGGRKALLTQ